jgi:hypothetical protein
MGHKQPPTFATASAGLASAPDAGERQGLNVARIDTGKPPGPVASGRAFDMALHREPRNAAAVPHRNRCRPRAAPVVRCIGLPPIAAADCVGLSQMSRGQPRATRPERDRRGGVILAPLATVPGRDRPKWVVAINRNAWSQSIGISGHNQSVRAPTA